MRRPSALALLLLIAGCSAFTSLGWWQWGRASFKEAQFAAWDRALEAAPQQIHALALDRIEAPLRVRGRVEFEGQRLWLLDNQQREGRNGLLALVPARVGPEGSWLLVNLGWLPWGADRRLLPQVTAPEGSVDVSGTLVAPPRAGLRLGPNLLADQGAGPRLIAHPDLDELAADLGQPLLPLMLLLDPEVGSELRRDWQPGLNTLSPERHRGYAVQWWGLALAALLIFFVLHRKTS